MSRLRPDWDQRSTDLGPYHHGPADPNAYRVSRNRHYPGVTPGLPGPQYFEDGYSAQQGHDIYEQRCKDNDGPRDTYNARRTTHSDYLQSLPPKEREYYMHNTGAFTPSAHAELKPLAREWSDAEARSHASAREDVYARGPMIHYHNADVAEGYYVDHNTYEIEARDCYDREVLHGYLPDNMPYNRRHPRDGHYSTVVDLPEFAMKAPRKKKGQK
ncbi:MAG: hypothetical protein Q9213_002188 [Squamulea squamosa]